MKALLFVGPSATGKTYVAETLIKKYPQSFELAKLHTTRSPRVGDTATDRIFLNSDKFEDMKKNNAFLAYGEFGGNFYGYSKESLVPASKNLLLNTWPAFLPNLAHLPDITIIGLQAPHNWQSLLANRLKSRGETPEMIHKRLTLIKEDIVLTDQHRALIESRGHFFTIKDDSTIPNEVIPWILTKLEL